jgi:hypothetical protein
VNEYTCTETQKDVDTQEHKQTFSQGHIESYADTWIQTSHGQTHMDRDTPGRNMYGHTQDRHTDVSTQRDMEIDKDKWAHTHRHT